MRMRTILSRERHDVLLHAITRSKVSKRLDRHDPREVNMKMSRYALGSSIVREPSSIMDHSSLLVIF